MFIIALTESVTARVNGGRAAARTRNSRLAGTLPVSGHASLHPGDRSSGLAGRGLTFTLIGVGFDMHAFAVIPEREVIAVSVPTVGTVPVTGLDVRGVAEEETISLMRVSLGM